MDMDSNNSTLSWSVTAFIAFVLNEWCYRHKELVDVEQHLAKCLSGVVGFEVIVYLAVNRLDKHGCPNLVKDFMFYGITRQGTDSPWAQKVGTQKTCLTVSSTISRIVSNGFSTLELTLSVITSYSANSIDKSPSSGAVQVPPAVSELLYSPNSHHYCCRRSGSYLKLLATWLPSCLSFAPFFQLTSRAVLQIAGCVPGPNTET